MGGTDITVQFIHILIGASPYIMIFVSGMLVGSMVPTYYAGERLRGFGRAMFNKVPYEPPPGLNKEQALVKATTEDELDKEGGDEEQSEKEK